MTEERVDNDMGEDDQRLLGVMTAQISGLSEQLKQSRQELREDIRGIYTRLDTLTVDGCAKGKEHSRDIRRLQDQPARTISIGAAIASVVAMIGTLIAMIRGGMQ